MDDTVPNSVSLLKEITLFLPALVHVKHLRIHSRIHLIKVIEHNNVDPGLYLQLDALHALHLFPYWTQNSFSCVGRPRTTGMDVWSPAAHKMSLGITLNSKLVQMVSLHVSTGMRVCVDVKETLEHQVQKTQKWTFIIYCQQTKVLLLRSSSVCTFKCSCSLLNMKDE